MFTLIGILALAAIAWYFRAQITAWFNTVEPGLVSDLEGNPTAAPSTAAPVAKPAQAVSGTGQTDPPKA